MILGLSVHIFTLIHVVISLLGLVFGFLALAELIGNSSSGLVTGLFLGFTIFTSATGFLFPFTTLDPARIVGIISLIVLGVALLARYGRRLAGPWRVIYVVSAVLALYFNVFVGVAQAFEKIPALHSLAPTGAERPFVAVQAAVLLAFAVLGVAAVKRFRAVTSSRQSA